MEKAKKRFFSTQRLTIMALLAAIAGILFYYEVPVFPAVFIYKLDFSNIPVLLGTFALGPIEGSIILLIKSLSGLLHSNSGGIGEFADFLIGLAMVLPSGFIYRHMKSRKGAVIGMIVGSISATIVGVLSNVYILIPIFVGNGAITISAIISMGQSVFPSIDTLWEFVALVTLPFNLIKWAAISVVGGLIYKPLSPILHGKKLFRQG